MTAFFAWLFNKQQELDRQESEWQAHPIPIGMHPVMESNGLMVTTSSCGPFRRWQGISGERFIQTQPGEQMTKEDEDWMYGKDKEVKDVTVADINKKDIPRKTLKEHNSEKSIQWMRENKSIHNGIQCPACEDELWDVDPNVTLTTNPPQKRVYCTSCGYQGLRIA